MRQAVQIPPPSLSLWLLATSVLVLNVIDGVFTLGWIEAGAATEANPLMGHALDNGPISFMLLKIVLVSLGVSLLWRLRHLKVAVAGLAGVATVYAFLFAYHLQALPIVVG